MIATSKQNKSRNACRKDREPKSGTIWYGSQPPKAKRSGVCNMIRQGLQTNSHSENTSLYGLDWIGCYQECMETLLPIGEKGAHASDAQIQNNNRTLNTFIRFKLFIVILFTTAIVRVIKWMN